MLVKDINELFFSQLALSTYQSCGLKFRRRYLDGLYWPADWGGSEEQKQMVEKGRLFHQLAHRYYSRGEVVTQQLLNGKLKNWFQNLKGFRPYNDLDIFYPEHVLRTNQEQMKLLAKYDLLYINSKRNKVIIYDWKTNSQSLDPGKIKNNIQTRVYLYVLAEAGHKYFPETNLSLDKLQIVYWNPRYPGDPVKLTYSKKQKDRDRSYFIQLINEIKHKDYKEYKAVEDENICKYCEYRPICHNKKPEDLEFSEKELDLDPDWEAIEEIQFTGDVF